MSIDNDEDAIRMGINKLNYSEFTRRRPDFREVTFQRRKELPDELKPLRHIERFINEDSESFD